MLVSFPRTQLSEHHVVTNSNLPTNDLFPVHLYLMRSHRTRGRLNEILANLFQVVWDNTAVVCNCYLLQDTSQKAQYFMFCFLCLFFFFWRKPHRSEHLIPL